MSKVQNSGGVSFCGLLTILFTGLKLTGYIDWSWWFVLMPMWLPFVLVLVILFIISGVKALDNSR